MRKPVLANPDSAVPVAEMSRFVYTSYLCFRAEVEP